MKFTKYISLKKLKGSKNCKNIDFFVCNIVFAWQLIIWLSYTQSCICKTSKLKNNESSQVVEPFTILHFFFPKIVMGIIESHCECCFPYVFTIFKYGGIEIGWMWHHTAAGPYRVGKFFLCVTTQTRQKIARNGASKPFLAIFVVSGCV